jgi:hypothetical protein
VLPVDEAVAPVAHFANRDGLGEVEFADTLDESSEVLVGQHVRVLTVLRVVHE